MKWLPYRRPKCDCDADRSEITHVLEGFRGKPRRIRRAQMIRHYRDRDDAYFWHWSDTKVVKI